MRSAGRRFRGSVGSCLPPPQGRRSEQCSLLVSPCRETGLPRTARDGVAGDREPIVELKNRGASDGAQPNTRLLADTRYSPHRFHTLAQDISAVVAPVSSQAYSAGIPKTLSQT